LIRLAGRECQETVSTTRLLTLLDTGGIGLDVPFCIGDEFLIGVGELLQGSGVDFLSVPDSFLLSLGICFFIVAEPF
jgi:hypothetical protein